MHNLVRYVEANMNSLKFSYADFGKTVICGIIRHRIIRVRIVRHRTNIVNLSIRSGNLAKSVLDIYLQLLYSIHLRSQTVRWSACIVTPTTMELTETWSRPWFLSFSSGGLPEHDKW